MALRKALGTIDSNGTIKITTNQAVVLDRAFLDSLARVPAPDENASTSKGKVTKRKAAAEPREEIDIDDDRCQTVNISCNAVRTKIRKFIESGEMKAGEFQKAIGANSKSYYTFMNQNGPTKGSNSMVYQNAFAFFKHRELNGIKAPKKPKHTPSDDDDKALNVSGITLEGESDGEVEVYDTCDSARQKIRAFLTAHPTITQVSFCREISKTFHDGRSVSSAVMSGFLSKKGPREGNTSAAFYASYVLFEKMRIRDGKPKSDFREIMEDIYDGTEKCGSGKRGMDVKKRPDRRYIVSVGYRGHGPVEDEFGQVSMF